LILLYLDPSSGSYLVQAIIAGALGGWFWLKGYFWKIKGFFKKNKVKDAKEDQEANN
jgi:hypothetical protein